MDFLRAFSLLMILGGCFGGGLFLSRKTASQLASTRQAAALLAFFSARIAAESPPLPVLFKKAAESSRFTELTFLPILARLELPPKEAFRSALAASHTLLPETARILLETGDFLGTCDRRETCAQLDALSSELCALLPGLEKKTAEYSRLCPTLGLLGGVFLDILLL